ncbi:MAG: CBS domain-containing protein [bacterium]|nr:CBS domain-containing protein [bacterium]
MKQLKAKDVMSGAVVTVRVDLTLRQGLDPDRAKISGAPIEDDEEPAGVVSVTDINRSAAQPISVAPECRRSSKGAVFFRLFSRNGGQPAT